MRINMLLINCQNSYWLFNCAAVWILTLSLYHMSICQSEAMVPTAIGSLPFEYGRYSEFSSLSELMDRNNSTFTGISPDEDPDLKMMVRNKREASSQPSGLVPLIVRFLSSIKNFILGLFGIKKKGGYSRLPDLEHGQKPTEGQPEKPQFATPPPPPTTAMPVHPYTPRPPPLPMFHYEQYDSSDFGKVMLRFKQQHKEFKDINYEIKHLTINYDNGLCVVFTLHRMFKGKSPAGKRVIVVGHGITNNALTWIVNGIKSTAFMLADSGYDVWLTNWRGTKDSLDVGMVDKSTGKCVKFGTGHIPKSDEKKWMEQFWHFGFEEMGKEDLPRILAFVLMETGADKVAYGGFSMAMPIFFSMFELAPLYTDEHGNVLWDWNDKLWAVVSFAGAAILQSTSRLAGLLKWYIDNVSVGIQSGIQNGDMLGKLAKKLQRGNRIRMQYIAGGDFRMIDEGAFRIFLKYMNGGSSKRSLKHLLQLIADPGIDGELRRYDKGASNNLLLYGQETPPIYHYDALKVRILLIYGVEDQLVPIQGSRALCRKLIAAIECIEVPLGHLDFMYTTDLDKQVNVKVISWLDGQFSLPTHRFTDLEMEQRKQLKHKDQEAFLKNVRAVYDPKKHGYKLDEAEEKLKEQQRQNHVDTEKLMVELGDG